MTIQLSRRNFLFASAAVGGAAVEGLAGVATGAAGVSEGVAGLAAGTASGGVAAAAGLAVVGATSGDALAGEA
jgi:phosphodiesterase/alkaline phosphatase D-like protein